MNSDPQRRPAYEPLYDIDPETGGTVQVFYVGRRLAELSGMRGAGWFWTLGRPGLLRGGAPMGPFTSGYAAYRDALETWSPASTAVAPIAPHPR